MKKVAKLQTKSTANFTNVCVNRLRFLASFASKLFNKALVPDSIQKYTFLRDVSNVTIIPVQLVISEIFYDFPDCIKLRSQNFVSQF